MEFPNPASPTLRPAHERFSHILSPRTARHDNGRNLTLLPVKITLNTRIPEDRRPQIEALVNRQVRPSEIVWLPSRFPHYVMFIDPGPDNSGDAPNGSIFDAPSSGTQSLSSVTAALEDAIKAALAKPAK